MNRTKPWIEIGVRPRQKAEVRRDLDGTILIWWDNSDLTVLLSPEEARDLVAKVIDVQLSPQPVTLDDEDSENGERRD